MFDWIAALFSTTGYVPRKQCGEWTAGWLALHIGSDVLIWLAYLSIPIVLLTVSRHPAIRGFRSFRPLFWLFAAFILACGFTHLIEAVIFEQPVYRLAGVMKAVTAAVSWVTVFALVPAAPRLLDQLGTRVGEFRPAPDVSASAPRSLLYSLAILVALLSILIRYTLDPVLDGQFPFVLSFLAVTFVSWYGGFGPGLVTLFLSAIATTYLFVIPRNQLPAGDLNGAVGFGLYLLSGVGVAVLGEAQRTNRRRLSSRMTDLWAATDALASEKRKVDDALTALDAFVQHAPYAIARLDSDLRLVRLNGVFARAHGITVESHIGQPLTMLPDELTTELRRVVQTGDMMPNRIVAGPIGTWEWTAFPVPLTDGRSGLGVIGIDVTERIRGEERLKESEERFRAMADGIPQLAWMTRPDGHIFWYNQRWYDYTGTTPDEMEGWGWEKVHDPAELDRVVAKWRAALATGEPWEDTFPLRRHDGEFRWHLSQAVPLKDEHGHIHLWFGTNTDVTGQRKLEQAVRESEANFRQLADAMPQIVYVTGPDGRIEYVNQRWIEYAGPVNADSPDLAPLVHPQDLEPLLAKWHQSAATNTPLVAEFRLRGGDGGEYRWFLTRAVPVSGPDGRPAKWYGTSTDIHDQVQTTIALRESQRFITSIINSLPDHLVVIDAEGTILTVNESWQRFGEANGIPPGYVWVGQNYFTAAQNDRIGVQAIEGVTAVARGERAMFELEYPCHGGGEERYFVLQANRFRGDGPVRLVLTHENITQRVRAERQIREGASQLLQLTEGMPLLMWACQASGECDYLSRQWVEYTGRSAEEQLGDRWVDVLHPDDRERTFAAWRAAVDGTAEYVVDYRMRRHDGEYRWFAVRGIPLRNQAGRIIRWYGCCTDIDDRIRQEAVLENLVVQRTNELDRQRVFLNAILDNVTEGIVACDSDGRLKLFNAATRGLHGLPAEPLSPDQWTEYYHLYEPDGVTPMPADQIPLVRAWRGEVVRDAEMVIRPVDQPERYVLCSGQQLRSADGAVDGAVVSMRDMTQRRKYERQLLSTTAALKASNEELEKFAYIASHDLQEPLRKIQAFGTRLASKHREAVGPEGKDYIDRMLDSAGRMRKLIDDLLSFSRVTTTATPFGPVDLNAVVQDVRSDLEHQIERSGGHLEIGPLPTLSGDASQIRQVFQNLIGNALKFARPGVSPVVRVTATAFADLPAAADPPPPTGGGWRIAVEDNGIGFDQEYAVRIFELFQRLHARTEYEGTGLGLAIVRKIILRHGASVVARSRPNNGTSFLIDWPVS